MKNIDTGMGVERMAAILQGVESVFETDVFRPIVALAEERSGRSWGQDAATDRALGVVADHGRGAAFLMADGVVPSNEERGYVLRRIMRRTMRQAHVLGIEGSFLPELYERVVETMGDAYPELRREWPTIERWARSEEESFGRTLEQGERLLAELVERAKSRADVLGARRGRLPPARHLRLPLRDDQGAARRGGPVGRRPGLRGADGAGARDLAPRRRLRDRRRRLRRARSSTTT